MIFSNELRLSLMADFSLVLWIYSEAAFPYEIDFSSCDHSHITSLPSQNHSIFLHALCLPPCLREARMKECTQCHFSCNVWDFCANDAVHRFQISVRSSACRKDLGFRPSENFQFGVNTACKTKLPHSAFTPCTLGTATSCNFQWKCNKETW